MMVILVPWVLLQVGIGDQLGSRDREQKEFRIIRGFEGPGREEYSHSDEVLSSPAFPPEFFLTFFQDRGTVVKV